MTVGLRQTKKFLAGHELLLTLRARDIFKISHSSSLQIGVLEWRSTGVLGFFLTHYSITPVLHYSAPPHPHGSTGICSHLFSPMILSGSMRDSTSFEIANRSANDFR